MTLRRKDPLFCLLIAIFVAATAWAFSISARAAGPAESAARVKKPAAFEYEVKNGDTLGAIALSQGIDLPRLMEANGIEDADLLYAGQKLRLPKASEHGRITKNGVVLNVPKGFNLSRIAAAYGVPTKTLIRANKLKNPDHLRDGQKIFVPGAKNVIELVPPPPCFKDPVTLYRVRRDETHEVPLCFCNGRPNPKAVEVLSAMSGPTGKEIPFPLHPRLVQMLQRIADRFPGQRIEIISGQRVRKQKGNESYHNKGQALDFRVAGVSNRALVSFVRTFKNVGAGYYPNSVFIHMDTRDRDAYWIDYSKPGEKSIYGRAGMTKREIKKIRDKRNEKKASKISRKARSGISKFIKSIKEKIES
ncbi:MAG: LysM peptidoglycan-binding domain-containing protein [Proteobacteria bacterium]|nr:LysM peptidoglycan-binding domain-containing protein [Pseudomonadota bacterium]